MNRLLEMLFVCVVASLVVACASVSYTPYLPTVNWEAPPAATAPQPVPPAIPLEQVG